MDPRPAAQLIVDTVNDNAGNISLCCLGPLTNIAAALEIDPDLPSKVNKVVLIGGSFGVTPYAWTQATGDNPVSEWNIFVDPESARMVFRAGFNLLAVGLDVATHPSINFRPQDMELLRSSPRPETVLASRIVGFVQSRGYQSYCSLIDSTAVAALIDPTLVRTETLKCDVEVAGDLTRGMTVVDRRMHHQWESMPTIEVVSSFDYERFLDLVTAELCKP